MIESAPNNQGGKPRARCVCDQCKAEVLISVLTVPSASTVRGRKNSSSIDEGYVRKRLNKMGWDVRRSMICADCVAKRKSQPANEPISPVTEDKPMSVAVPKVEVAKPREPSPKQKREIIGLLELAYDDGAKRYKPGESDKKIAEVIGGGVLWGWVSQIREDLFGPDTRNQELDDLRKDAAKLAGDIQTHQADLRIIKESLKGVEGHVNTLVAKLAALNSRLDKVA